MTHDGKEVLLQYVKTPEDERGSLTEKQEEIFLRVVQMISLKEKHRVDKDAIAIHMELQKQKGKSISQAAAYRDLNTAKFIQGEINEVHRKFERYALSNWTKEVMMKAIEIDDLRAFNQGMANLIKINRLDQPDPIPIDYSKFQPVRPVFGFFPDIFTHQDLPESEEDFLEEMRRLREPEKYKKKVLDGEFDDHEEVA